jgi:hypothetical protein
LTVNNRNTSHTTPEQAAELVNQIIHAGDDVAAGALAALVSALAAVSDEETRQELAAAVAERAYTRTDAFGNAVLALMHGTAMQLHGKAIH